MFKVGDNVKCISKSWASIDYGKSYKVAKVCREGIKVFKQNSRYVIDCVYHRDNFIIDKRSNRDLE